MENRSACLALALGLAVVLLSTSKAQAIPAFARLYKTECNTCHTVFPDRKPFGDAFRKNSYVWPGKLSEQMEEEAQYTSREKAAFQGMSSSGQKKQRVNKWLTAIPDQVPISFWVNHDIIFNKNAKRGITGTDATGQPANITVPATQLDFDGGTELELFTAGSFRGKAGWWAEYNFAPEHDIGEIYIQFRHLFGSPINLKGGRFKPGLSLWKSNDSATVSEYGYNGMVVGANPFMITREQGAVEVNSLIGNRVFLATGITTPPEKQRNGVDYYGHASVRFGGVDFAGNDPDISLTTESIWENLALTFGSFVYIGTSVNETPDFATSSVQKFKNSFYRVGLESEVLFKNLRFRVNGILGQDKNPVGPEGLDVSEKSLSLMAQGQYIFMQNLLGAMRFEYQDIEHEGITRRYIPSIVYAPWQNVRVALEYVHEIRPRVIDQEYINRIYTCRLTFAY